MSYPVTFHDSAKEDILNIEEYLSQFYPSTARKFFESLMSKLELLGDSPHMYPAYEDNPLFRKMVVGDYLVFYVFDEQHNVVKIQRIFHHSRDIGQLI